MEIMEQDYTQELVNCQICNHIKKNTSLLDCFHNICQECEQENENITCQSCHQNRQIPREGIHHQLNNLLYEYLTNQEAVDPDIKKCTMCGKLEDTVYCTNCGTYWCEFGIDELHNNIIARGYKHVLNRDVAQFDFHLMPKGDGDQDDEAEWDKMLGVFEKMENDGREHQTQITQEKNSLEEWKREQENEVGSSFDRIIEKLMEGKRNFIDELNYKCGRMQDQLEECKNTNKTNLTTLRRAHQLVTKMKFHKLTPESMKEFLIDRKIIQNIGTKPVTGMIKQVDKGALGEVEGLDLTASSTVTIPSLKYSRLTLPPNGKVGEEIKIEVCLKNSLNQTIKGRANESIYVQITKNGTSKLHQVTDINPPTAQFLASQSGRYEAKLEIRGRVGTKCESTEISRAMLPETITPVIRSIEEKGLHRAITTSADNHLYCVVKEPPEIRKYYVSKPIPHGENTSREESISLDINFGQGQLGSPCGICYLDAYLYVADAGLNCVHIFTNNGAYVERFGRTGQELGQFQRPMGIDYDYLRREIVIADTFNNRIQSCNDTADTRVFDCFGTNEHFMLKDPVDIKACRNGKTVVTTLKAQILLYDIARNFSQVIICDILTPRHCCLDSDDNIYVTSHLGHSVYKLLQTEGGMNLFEKIKLKTDPEFRFPTGVATNRDGKLYVISRELNPESTKSFLSIW